MTHQLVARSIVFIPAYQQLNLARQRNTLREWGFTEEQFSELGEPPAWPEDRLSAVVLDVSLETVGKTFEEAWGCICQAQKDHDAGHWRLYEVKSDPEHLRLLEGIAFEPMTLRWRVVDLAANWDRQRGICPRDVRSPENSPSSAILWAASYFPKWVQAMDGANVPYVWLPGYELSVVRFVSRSLVLFLFWDRDPRRVLLNARSADDRGSCWAVPAFRE